MFKTNNKIKREKMNSFINRGLSRGRTLLNEWLVYYKMQWAF